MYRSLIVKILAVGVIIFLLMVPLVMIDGLVRERQAHRDEVVQDIARSSSYAQQLTGPVLVVPYRKTIRESTLNSATRQREVAERIVLGQIHILPELFALDGRLQTQRRSRGIYEARLFHASNRISGHFEVPARFGVGEDSPDYIFGEPFLALGISDIRGISNALTLRFDGTTVNFQPGSATALLGSGVHAPLPRLVGTTAVRRVDFELQLDLQGTGQFDVTPVGRESRVAISSDWPHPSFDGEFLPVQREVNGRGFTARWQTSFFATNLLEALDDCVGKDKCEAFKSRHFGVSLIDPVDQYLKTDRAIKYALLFIVLTFAAVSLFELLKKVAVHPVQYGLVGLALALFYLLLLSLSEHIGFTLAYLVAAGACVGLLGYYITFMLKSLARGLGFGAGIAALYGLLYGLLGAEDYALLMGSILLFGVLGIFMVLTRKVDWFGAGTRSQAV